MSTGSPDALERATARLRANPRRFLVTGAAGFIGSHLIESLLALGQHVVGLDNFATGSRENLDEVRERVGASAWRRHTFIEADIVDLAACRRACNGIDVVLHEAALGSVPRSIADPLATHAANATGFLNLLAAAREANVARIVYASSSSTYGDHPALPKVEDVIGAPLSPYAVTKYVNELYADVFRRCYGSAMIGLRYFNVFGPRQDPDGAYAAVIPRFVAAMLREEQVTIFGDGETTRDFCYVDNVVQANLLAATVENPRALGQVYNVAVGERMSLNDLHAALRDLVAQHHPELHIPAPRHADFRAGDVRHSEADIGKARGLLGYAPQWNARSGLADALPWYERHFEPAALASSSAELRAG
ncbi:MAG TPA: SDR family oxidoreductase [Casimicrobiaceae bacterium]|nr:SDR family oxidoreductase [Casimicrobiaceae bacterium]